MPGEWVQIQNSGRETHRDFGVFVHFVFDLNDNLARILAGLPSTIRLELRDGFRGARAPFCVDGSKRLERWTAWTRNREFREVRAVLVRISRGQYASGKWAMGGGPQFSSRRTLMDTSMTVMVVEDVVSARETILHLLRALGFSSFVEAENGNVALEKLKHHAVDLIISDWNMPFLNGIDMLREIRKDSALRYIPFIFLTSKSGIEDVAQASELGISGYVVKPVTIRSLHETLSSLCGMPCEKELDALKTEVMNLCATGEHVMAGKLLLDFEAKHPNYRPKILFERAMVDMKAGNIDSADEAITEALRAQPLFAAGWELKTRIFAYREMWDSALKAVDKALTINRNNADYHVLQGSINLNKNNRDEARHNFMTAYTLDPQNDRIKQDIWNAYIELDLPEEAESSFGSYFFADLTCNTLNNMAVG